MLKITFKNFTSNISSFKNISIGKFANFKINSSEKKETALNNKINQDSSTLYDASIASSQ